MQPAHPIYLLRNGETEWNVEGRLQGSLDSPLTARGIAQIVAMGNKLSGMLDKALNWELVSSPLGRTQQSAGIIAGLCHLPLRLDDRLREISLGAWSGMTWEDIERSQPGASTRRGRVFHALNGEHFDEIAARVLNWLVSIDRPTIAMSHGITGQVIRGLYLGTTDLRSQPDHTRDNGFYLLENGAATFIDCPS